MTLAPNHTAGKRKGREWGEGRGREERDRVELAHEPWCAMSVWVTRDLGVVRETPGSQPWPAITATQHPRGPAPQCRPAPLLLCLSYQPCPR